jgi:hypothetical protein
MPQRRLIQRDVFTSVAIKSNGLAVVVDGEGLWVRHDANAWFRSLHALGRCDAQKAEMMREYPSDLMAEQEARPALLFGIRAQHRAIPVEDRERAGEPVKIAAQPVRFE